VATAALDDAARLGSFEWDGTFGNFGIDDFFVTRIGGEAADPNSEFWALYVNRRSSTQGGCQRRVQQGDEVLWARVSFLGPPVVPALELRGPGQARTGEAVTVRVINVESGAPEPGATVNGALTGADGAATLSFPAAGVYRLKADKPQTVRSNTLVLCVDPPGADPCTSADRSAPSLAVTLPGARLASERGRSRTMLVSWQADDGSGAGVSHYSVEVREVGSGLGSAAIAPGAWRTLYPRTTVPSVHFRGESGHAYQFRIGATDRAANRASVETDALLLPVDDRDRGLWRFSRRGWKRVRSESAWGGTVMRAPGAGATARLRFEGRSVALVGRRVPSGGRLRVTVAGRSRVLRLRGRSGPRALLWQSRRLADGPHVLRIRSLGGGRAVLDAVAPQP
jgi:hypothetical protein